MFINRLGLCLKLAQLLLLGITTVAAQDQSSGVIRGTAVDENGSPVEGALVNASPVARVGLSQHTLIRRVPTDAAGHFVIDRLQWGKYMFSAKKVESAYADTFFSFYYSAAGPQATITPASPTADVLIRLGPKAGVLMGSVTNAETGAPVDAGFKLTRTAPTNDWYSTSAESRYWVLLPSSVDVFVEVSAPGFKTWTSPGPLNLQPGAEMHLNVPLDPSPDLSLEPSQFLIPEGRVGWFLLVYNVKDSPPSPAIAGVKVFKFQQETVLRTSSPGPESGAKTTYFYYSGDGRLRKVPMDYRDGQGMIWGEYEGTIDGVTAEFGFFVGTEEEYTKAKTHRPAR